MKFSVAWTDRLEAVRHWGLVFVLITGATVTGFFFDHQISLTSHAMFYVLAVVIASYTLPWKESVVCAVGAVTAFNFFFVPPRMTFEVDSREHLIALFTMLLVALVISHLSARLRRESATAQRNEQRARQLQELATALSNVGNTDEIIALGQGALDEAFGGPNWLAVVGADGALAVPTALASDVADGMACCVREWAVLGPGTGRWPGLNAWYLPLGDKEPMEGAACVQPALSADFAAREHAQALCALLAQAMFRLRMMRSMLAAQREAQRQQLQSTFLAAISHDLRTPLAAVVGAASSLQLQGEKLSPQERDRLLASIVNEASYLSTITENTLQLVRLTNASQALHRDWESMEEIVGAVLARVRKGDPARRVSSKIPEHLPLIKADPVLLAQLMVNLLDNALKYSAGPVDLTVGTDGGDMRVSVKDRGPGIPTEDFQTIFEPYARNDLSGQRGAGLGLALCRAIAQAHGGSLTLRRRSGGGNSFTLAMPIDEQVPLGEPP
jgi:two-component system sensor histidine kinase KdpD